MPSEEEKTETVVYVGDMKEAQINSPYKQIFRQDEEVKVTREMAKVLKGHPHFKQTSIKLKPLSDIEQLKTMSEGEQRDYLIKKSKDWKKFQKWAKDNFNTTDTSKKELVEEIIDKLKEG